MTASRGRISFMVTFSLARFDPNDLFNDLFNDPFNDPSMTNA